jgi:hypothetical protein
MHAPQLTAPPRLFAALEARFWACVPGAPQKCTLEVNRQLLVRRSHQMNHVTVDTAHAV